MENIIALFAVLGAFTMTIVIVLALTRARQRRLELQTEVQTKMIEKFGSAPELINFLQSPAGREFVAGVQGSPAATTTSRVIGGIRSAIILSALGLAFLAIWIVSHDEGLMYPAFILLALGIGFYIASVVSMRLSKSMAEQAERGEIRPPAL